MHVRLPEPPRSGEVALRATDLAKSFGPNDVFSEGLALPTIWVPHCTPQGCDTHHFRIGADLGRRRQL